MKIDIRALQLLHAHIFYLNDQKKEQEALAVKYKDSMASWYLGRASGIQIAMQEFSLE